MTVIDDLPEELLAQILQPLSVKEKLNSQLVCRSWREVLQHPKVPGLWGTVCINLNHLAALVKGPDGLPVLSPRSVLPREHLDGWFWVLVPLHRWLMRRCVGRGITQIAFEASVIDLHPTASQIIVLLSNMLVPMLTGSLGPVSPIKFKLSLQGYGGLDWDSRTALMTSLKMLQDTELLQQVAHRIVDLRLDCAPAFAWSHLGQLTALSRLAVNIDDTRLPAGTQGTRPSDGYQVLYPMNAALHRLKHLRSLALGNVVTDRGMPLHAMDLHPSTLHQLTHLGITGAAMNFMAGAQALPELQSLALCSGHPHRPHIHGLPVLALGLGAATPALRSLQLEGFEITAELSCLHGLRQLHMSRLLCLGCTSQAPLTHVQLITGPAAASLKVLRMPRLMSMNPLQTLGHSLAAVAQLQELYMPGLDLDCTYLPPLPPGVKVLDLSHNNFLDIPDGLKALPALEALDLSEQSTDFQLARPLTFVRQCRRLQSVRLQQNCTEQHEWSCLSLHSIACTAQLVKELPAGRSVDITFWASQMQR